MTSQPNGAATTADSKEDKPSLDLSFSKVAGGALAAVTTAVVASFFGVTGTLSGAAFGSVVSSVAAAVYATSLSTAHKRIRTTGVSLLRSPSRPGDTDSSGSGPPGDQTQVLPTVGPGETQVLRVTGPPGAPPPARGSQPPPARNQPPWQTPGGNAGHPGGSGHGASRALHRREAEGKAAVAAARRVPWKPVALLAGVIFVVAVAAISMTELFIGHPIGNAQGTGTSIGTVVDGGGARDPNRPTPAPTRTQDSGVPSDSPSDTQGPSASQSPTDSAPPTDTAHSGQAGPTSPEPGGSTASPSASSPGPTGPAQPTNARGGGGTTGASGPAAPTAGPTG